MRRILATTVLISPLFLSAAALASQSASDAVASTRPLSTGVTPIQVVYTPRIELSSMAAETVLPNAEVVLKLNVDENGQPQNVQVVKSPNQFLDEPVSAAIRQARFRPAKLDNQPVATDLTLTVVVAQ
ncbi:MAG TPA: TonB family protein [Terracidiphilus sp.]|jgi:TonB family protein|nr:TonB family protein [Terracidiphilus sp.]